MRNPDQTRKALAADLKHFTTAFDRAKMNDTRASDVNDRIKALLSELVMIYTSEKHGEIVAAASKPRRRVA